MDRPKLVLVAAGAGLGALVARVLRRERVATEPPPRGELYASTGMATTEPPSEPAPPADAPETPGTSAPPL